MKTRGIYQIRSLINGRIYVGGSIDLPQRWVQHKTQLRTGKHPSKRLLFDFREHGLNKFVFEVLQKLEPGEDLRAVEQRWINKLRPCEEARGYNTHPDARGPRGVKRSAAFKRRAAEMATGAIFTKERCDNISAARKNSPKAQSALDDLNHVKRRLSDDDARTVVRRRTEGKTIMEIANEFGVSRRPIRAILTGETYFDATGMPQKPRALKRRG